MWYILCPSPYWNFQIDNWTSMFFFLKLSYYSVVVIKCIFLHRKIHKYCCALAWKLPRQPYFSHEWYQGGFGAKLSCSGWRHSPWWQWVCMYEISYDTIPKTLNPSGGKVQHCTLQNKSHHWKNLRMVEEAISCPSLGNPNAPRESVHYHR